MIRYTLLLIAWITGVYALASWMCGLLTDAGVAGAASAAAVLMAECAAYCQRRRWRQGREQVWERREAEAAANADLFCERWLDCRTYVKDGGGSCPCFPPAESLPELQGIWDWSAGAPE